MASSYYDSAGKSVSDGDIAYAADLNTINSAVDTGFQLAEAAIVLIGANQSYYSDLAQKWAEEVEDTPVTVGHYSALHWAAKAEDQAILADADRVQTNNDRLATAADRVNTNNDKIATAADRVQTGLDRTQTGLDKVATAADRVQTGLDATATAADRVQTGLDAAAAAASAGLFPVLASGDEGKVLIVDTPFSNGITLQSNSGPVGSIIMWPTSTAPSGYLECNGSAISRVTYAALFSVLGTTYGSGDGSTTFNIPDFRGEFLRGWDHGSAHDPNAATRTDRGDGTGGDVVGSKQADAFKSHQHSAVLTVAASITPTAGPYSAGSPGSTGLTGGLETRPRNINVMYCIKYS